MLSNTARSILTELRHGPLDAYELAGELEAAPFTIRAELKALHRRRPSLVYELADGRWELSDPAAELVDSLQLRLEL